MGYATIKQAARLLECSKGRVRDLIRNGILCGYTESDPKANPYSGNMRWMIDFESIERRIAAVEAAKGT